MTTDHALALYRTYRQVLDHAAAVAAELDRLEDENQRLRRDVLAMAERIAAQSELLAKRAERTGR